MKGRSGAAGQGGARGTRGCHCAQHGVPCARSGRACSTGTGRAVQGVTAAVAACPLQVADSESSSVRLMDLSSGGGKLLVGGDPLFSDNLFR